PERPILHVHLKNSHDLTIPGLSFPALIDTGADVSLAPREIGDLLGHEFSQGEQVDRLKGVGGESSVVYTHQVRIDILAPRGSKGNIELGSFNMPLRFVDQKLGYILLGQSDFLDHFDFRQIRRERFFELRRT
ncbi:MAG: hypothetical protein ACYTGH_15205, partial [Planctomycetota bacterium]